MLKRLVAKLPFSSSTKLRLKEILLNWKLALSNSGNPAGLNSELGIVNDIKRKSIEQIFSTKLKSSKKGSLNTDNHASIKIYHSFDEYERDAEQRKALSQKRSLFETKLLASPGQRFKYSGYCCVCNSNRKFEIDYLHPYKRHSAEKLTPNWREGLKCKSCGMNNRIRAAADLLQQQIMIQSSELIYATEEHTFFYKWLKRKHFNVIGSEFLGNDKVPGKTYKNLRHEDITCLSFSDASVDVILSFEVLEYVPDTERSISEFLRVLREGGLVLASAPFAWNNHETIVRAKVNDDGTIEHILEPEYHGNPTRPEDGSLCFYHFGWDLVYKFKSAGATDAAVISYYSVDKANLGNELFFFLILK